MYFNYFSQGYYDLKGDGNLKLLTDLFTRVKIRDKAFDVATLYDKYDVVSGEKPEDVAYRHFGNAQYHWIILLTNNITDRYYGWPLSIQSLNNIFTTNTTIQKQYIIMRNYNLVVVQQDKDLPIIHTL